MAVAHVNKTDLFYAEVGHGVPCLVRHGGLGVDHTQFREWLNPLGDVLRLVYYNHRGNGRSGRPPIVQDVTRHHDVRDLLYSALRLGKHVPGVSPMICREVVEFLTEYLSGEVQADQRLAFEQHLEACPECVAYVKSYEETVRLGKAVFSHADGRIPEDVPEELVQAILAARKKYE